MARKRPRLDAEVKSQELLERREFLTKKDAMEVLRQIPHGEWGRRHGGKMLTFGAYQWVQACGALPDGTLLPLGS